MAPQLCQIEQYACYRIVDLMMKHAFVSYKTSRVIINQAMRNIQQIQQDKEPFSDTSTMGGGRHVISLES